MNFAQQDPTIEDRIRQLFPVFEEEELIAEIAQKAHFITLPPDEVILKKDAYVKVVPLVLSGLVKVLQEGEEHDLLMYYIEAGESCIMSVTACFNNEKSRIKAVIDEEAEILAVPADLVVRWYKQYPSWNEFVTTLYRKRFLNLLDGFNSVVYDGIDDRLVHYLKQKAKSRASNELQLTHKKIAEDLGTAREVVSRLLKALETEGKVKIGRGKLTLTANF